jgi:hypothetical protein
MNNSDVQQLVFAIVKIALMVFTALHFFFMLYLLRRVFDMQQMLSTLKQTVIIAIIIAFCFFLLGLIIYIIALPV